MLTIHSQCLRFRMVQRTSSREHPVNWQTETFCCFRLSLHQRWKVVPEESGRGRRERWPTTRQFLHLQRAVCIQRPIIEGSESEWANPQYTTLAVFLQKISLYNKNRQELYMEGWPTHDHCPIHTERHNHDNSYIHL